MPLGLANHNLPYPIKAFLALLFLGILTLWMPGYWPTAIYLCCVFLLTCFEVMRERAAGAEMRSRLTVIVIVLLAILPIWGILQILLAVTVYEYPTWLGVLAVLSYGCVVYVFSGVSPRCVEKIGMAMLCFAFVVALFAILQSVTGGKVFWLFAPSTYSDFRMGPIVYHNHWAVFVEFVLPLAVNRVLRSPSGKVWLYSAMAATLYASVIICASRSGIIVCTAEILIVSLLVSRRNGALGATSRSVFALIVTLAVFTLITGPQLMIERFNSESGITAGRSDWDRTSLTMMGDHPWRGRGLGNWPTLYPEFATSDLGLYVNQAHNDWLQWAVEGSPYFLITLAVAAISFRTACCFPWAAGVPAVFCHALVDYPFSRPALASWAWTILGLALASKESGYKATLTKPGTPSTYRLCPLPESKPSRNLYPRASPTDPVVTPSEEAN